MGLLINRPGGHLLLWRGGEQIDPTSGPPRAALSSSHEPLSDSMGAFTAYRGSDLGVVNGGRLRALMKAERGNSGCMGQGRE